MLVKCLVANTLPKIFSELVTSCSLVESAMPAVQQYRICDNKGILHLEDSLAIN